MTHAVTSIDPRLIGMLGRKLYSSNPLPIVVRELLQNSIDACKRAGVEPDIRITIREDKDSHGNWIVTCTDNGIGMTADEIVDDFLRLGGKKKDGTNQTGGFGIAKAAIMGCANWKVRSLDNFLNRSILENGGNIRKQPFRKGTKVTVNIREYVYGSDIRTALQMIYYSDVKIHLVVKTKSYPYLTLDDPTAGLPELEARILEENNDFDFWGTGEFVIPELAERSSSGIKSICETGWNIIRLNGLMQMFRGSRLDYRKTNLFFDVKTTLMAEDPLYPFSMSREKLTEGIEELVDAFVQSHNANVLQSVAAVKDDVPEKEAVIILEGRLLSGVRNTKYDRHERASESGMGEKTASDLIIEKKLRRLAEENTAPVRMLIRRYKRDPLTKVWHAKVLLAWQDVLQLVAELDEEFGIGITSNPFQEAMRCNMDGTVFYVINPVLAIPDVLEQQSHEAIVLSLWALASHEVTHKYVDDHNEWFTTTENNIMRDSAEVILRALRKIAERLK